MLEVGSLVELEVIDVAYGGEFVARYGEAVVFVRGAVLGEKVLAQITKKQSKLYRAIVREVLLAAPGRIEHPWPLGSVEATGAADYGHMSLECQRQMKSQMLRNQLRRIGGEEILASFSKQMLEVESVENGRHGALIADPDSEGWHYRTRISVLKLETGVGMHLLQTHKLVALQQMPLASRRLDSLELFGDAWDRLVPQKEHLRLVAPSGSAPVVVIDGKAYGAPGVPANSSIREVVSYGGTSYEYLLNPNSFWQIHENAPNTLVQHVFDALEVDLGDNLVDLYSGSGLFSLVGADIVGASGSLRAYEGDKRATNSAQYNLRRFSHASAEATSIEAKNIGKLVADADFVIADPPRAGLGVEAAQILGRCAAKRIALVSCDSAAMARDVTAIMHSGRKLEEFYAVDIFPNTHYVETVSIFA